MILVSFKQSSFDQINLPKVQPNKLVIGSGDFLVFFLLFCKLQSYIPKPKWAYHMTCNLNVHWISYFLKCFQLSKLFNCLNVYCFFNFESFWIPSFQIKTNALKCFITIDFVWVLSNGNILEQNQNEWK